MLVLAWSVTVLITQPSRLTVLREMQHCSAQSSLTQVVYKTHTQVRIAAISQTATDRTANPLTLTPNTDLYVKWALYLSIHRRYLYKDILTLFI